jgi:hypothetical protein
MNPGAAIWLAEVRGGRLVRLEGGRDREELVRHLVREAETEPDLVVGLDFAFSFPGWFVESQGATSAVEFWEVVRREGERWLRDPRPPFWKTVGVPALPAERAHRQTELELGRVAGIAPTSVFKLVGPSQVGPGSIRGMPWLAELRQRGFSIWPFAAGRPLAVEIWPRALTGAVVKSRRAARADFLARRTPELREPLLGVAASTEDVFDAAVSAIVMARNAAGLAALRSEPKYALEGRIWHPEIVQPLR